MNEDKNSKEDLFRLRPRVLWIGGILILLIIWFIASDTNTSPDSDADIGGGPTFTVAKGPLTISVIESGTIKARDQEVIKSEVEGRTSILWLIKEGENVKKGDLLLELDASRLENQAVDQQIKLQNTEAAYIHARENVEIVKNKGLEDNEKAELTLIFAKQDLKKYVEGDFPKELNEAESKITVAREELQRANDKLKWSKVLFKEKFISQTELLADELATKRSELDLQLAEENLSLLKNFTYARKLAELKSEAKQAEMALERTKIKVAADQVQADADLLAKKSVFEREKKQLQKINDQITKTKIYAPSEGLVIYATTAQGSWRGNADPLAAGQEVGERQELIYLPKTASVLAEVKIHESNLDKVRVGLPVEVTVDAVPGKSFDGTVASISPLPDATSLWFNPDLKLYNTVVHLEGNGANLRTGMSCRAEIIITRFKEAIYIPVQAVTLVKGQPTVFVRQGSDAIPRNVKTDLDNNLMIRITEGLEPGEEILLTPPLDAGSSLN